ncbi:hypothetical protein V5738_14850 [Salinisphaera sp. SPP-AMP-43]|uniref:hypothetical protein n=1 Tax=Salinisphaera sp. SPP-AMP-43 TaxID=3121288 RepID=UPI003C6E6907
MSATDPRMCRRLIVGLAIVGAIVMSGCASQRAARPDLPDDSVLDPATQALDKAVAAHADQFAPRIVDSARRHLTVARDILFSAAEVDRPLTDAEDDRIQTLVEQARLDARAALVKTQAGAVGQKLDQLQGRGSDQNSSAAGGASSSLGGARQQRSGLSPLGSGNNTLGGM